MSHSSTEWDEETLRRASSYCGGDPRIAREVNDEVFSTYSQTWPLPEFMAELHAAIERIPEASRTSAVVELESGDEYTSGNLTIRYKRLETEAEVDERCVRALAYVRDNQARERAIYERLKQKFEG